jgi:hypothetical protein
MAASFLYSWVMTFVSSGEALVPGTHPTTMVRIGATLPGVGSVGEAPQ